jgi:CheY-like chemotaxis protein
MLMSTGNETLLAETSAEGRIGPAEKKATATRTCVWLVDDNRNLRELLAGLLAADGEFECARQFASAEALLDVLAGEAPPEVILLDNQMGGMTGLAALRPIKRLAPSTRVLMLTGCSDGETRARALRDGAADFLSKSWNILEIARRIQLAMARPLTAVPADDPPEHGLEAGGSGAAGRCEARPEFPDAGFALTTQSRLPDPGSAMTRKAGRRRGAWGSLVCGVNRFRALLKRTRVEF